MMTSSCLKLNNLLCLLVKDSWIIFILFLCDIQQLLAVLHPFLLVCSSNARSFYAPRPLIDRAQPPGMTQLPYLLYTTHSRASDTRTPWKAIIRMALRAIKKTKKFRVIFYHLHFFMLVISTSYSSIIIT